MDYQILLVISAKAEEIEQTSLDASVYFYRSLEVVVLEFQHNV